MSSLFQRTLGIQGTNLPTRRSLSITPANFGIGALMGQFQRKYAQAFKISSPAEFKAIFGGYFSSAAYGPDVVDDFFNNLNGQPGTLYIGSYLGNSGGTVDAVVASANLADQESSPQNTLELQAAYQTVQQYGEDGNNTGYTIETGNRFSATVTVQGTAPQTVIDLNSVIDIFVGDVVTVTFTGGTPGSIGLTVTAVDYTNNQITLSANLGAANFVNVGDTVAVPGFRIHTWRKSLSGIVEEVDTDLAQQWCTVISGVVDHFVENVFASSNYLLATALTLATQPTDPTQAQPAAVSSVTFLASGADGTQPTGSNQSAYWTNTLALFDNLPVRFLANTETSDVSTQKAGEAYCANRTDAPTWIYLLAANQTKSQLISIGNGYQRGNRVFGVAWGTWGYKTDPYQSSLLAPYRGVPNVGAMMGYWIRVIEKYGIHYVPALPNEGIIGWQDVYGYQATVDTDRTDLANAGVNVIQAVAGVGIVPRNAMSPCTSPDYVFPNAGLMSSYIKVSAVNSLGVTENKPLTYDKIQSDRSAIDMFLRQLWDHGSTGNVPQGETFAQSITQASDGSLQPSTYDQSVSVEANLANNTASDIQAGNETIYVYFMRPAPTGSIRIGVGIQLAA